MKRNTINPMVATQCRLICVHFGQNISLMVRRLLIVMTLLSGRKKLNGEPKRNSSGAKTKALPTALHPQQSAV
jgi:hypothetical protein